MEKEHLTTVINQPYDSFINPEIYEELVKLAKHSLSHSSRSNTLNTCDVVNNAVLKIYRVKSSHFKSRGHFFSLMSNIMRNLVIDHVRKKQAAKHGGDLFHVTLSNVDDNHQSLHSDMSRLLEIDNAMEKLKQHDQVLAQMIEMQFYGGVDIKDMAEFLEMSVSTVNRKLRLAKAFMKTQLRT